MSKGGLKTGEEKMMLRHSSCTRNAIDTATTPYQFLSALLEGRGEKLILSGPLLLFEKAI